MRILIVLLLGFASGLPLALTSSTLQAWFTEAGVNIVTIGILSLVGVPYLWKFSWSPFMDRFTFPWGGRRRGWIAFAQLALCAALFLLARLSPAEQPGLIGVLALLIAFFSASQDIAVDAYRTDLLLPAERGMGSAAYIFGYRMAMLLSGGLALILADYIGWKVTYEIMAVLMGIAIVVTYQAPEVKEPLDAPVSLKAAMLEPLKNLWQRDRIGLILIFILLYKAGDALALSLMSNFLLHGLGFSLTEVGLAYKTMGLLGTILGAFLGGFLLISLTIYRALWLFGLAQAFSTFLFVMLAWVGKHTVLMVTAIAIESFCSGMSTAAFVAYLMSLCDARYTATQFACFSALASVGRVMLGPVAGIMVSSLGWVSFYGWAFFLSFPGLFLIGLLKGKRVNEVLVQS